MILLALAVFASPLSMNAALDVTTAHQRAMQPASRGDAFEARARHGSETGVEPNEPQGPAMMGVGSSRTPRSTSIRGRGRLRLALVPYSPFAAKGEARIVVLRV
jgi:hypothetical protein